jgi:hypothetical protein
MIHIKCIEAYIVSFEQNQKLFNDGQKWIQFLANRSDELSRWKLNPIPTGSRNIDEEMATLPGAKRQVFLWDKLNKLLFVTISHPG